MPAAARRKNRLQCPLIRPRQPPPAAEPVDRRHPTANAKMSSMPVLTTSATARSTLAATCYQRWRRAPATSRTAATARKHRGHAPPPRHRQRALGIITDDKCNPPAAAGGRPTPRRAASVTPMQSSGHLRLTPTTARRQSSRQAPPRRHNQKQDAPNDGSERHALSTPATASRQYSSRARPPHQRQQLSVADAGAKSHHRACARGRPLTPPAPGGAHPPISDGPLTTPRAARRQRRRQPSLSHQW